MELDSILEWVSVDNKTLLINIETLVSTVVTLPESKICMISVACLVDIETISSMVSEVHLVTMIVGDLLSMLVSPWSDHSSLANAELLVVLVGDSKSSLTEGSDRLGTFVENEPLGLFTWKVISDLQSILLMTKVLPVVVNGFVA